MTEGRLYLKGLATRLELTRDLNALINIEADFDGNLSLHIDPSKLSATEKFRDFKDGFEQLADLLSTDPIFKNIKTVSATSWIVTEYPELLQRLGFTIDAEGKSELGNKLIKRYQNKAEKNVVPPNKRSVKPTYAFMTSSDFVRRYSRSKPSV